MDKLQIRSGLLIVVITYWANGFSVRANCLWASRLSCYMTRFGFTSFCRHKRQTNPSFICFFFTEPQETIKLSLGGRSIVVNFFENNFNISGFFLMHTASCPTKPQKRRFPTNLPTAWLSLNSSTLHHYFDCTLPGESLTGLSLTGKNASYFLCVQEGA